jgi:hypothetical protein
MAVSEKFLNGANLLAILQQLRGERMSERMVGGQLIELCRSNPDPPHGRGQLGRQDTRAPFLWGRRSWRTLCRKIRQLSRVSHSQLLAVCPWTSLQTCFTGLSAGT